MPVFIAAFLGALASMVGSLVGRAVVALGMGVVTFTGVSVTLTWVKGKAVESLLGLPHTMVSMLSALGVGEFISIIASALAARMLLNGLSEGGTIRKWVKK